MITAAQLEWACKRGMLECDLFLAPFVRQGFENLSDLEKSQLYELLEFPDPVLYEWFMGASNPTGPQSRFQALIEKIRCQNRVL